MKVFTFVGNEAGDSIASADKIGLQLVIEAAKKPDHVREAWRPLPYRYIGRAKRNHSDFPWAGSNFICLRSSAREALETILAPFGEFLPITIESSEDAWLYHPIGTTPALDLARSQYRAYPDGRISKVYSYAFLADQIGRRPLFRVPKLFQSFVTDQVVAAVKAARLTGLEFKMVWDSAWTVPPIPLLIVSGYWPPRAWDEAESARRTRTFLTELGELDVALRAWRRRGRGPLPEQAVAMPLTDAAVAKALDRIKERQHTADAIYHDGGIWNAPHDEIRVELQQATGTGQRFVNSIWGGVAHLRMFDLREEHTKHASPAGVLALFAAMRKAWPVQHLVARTNIFQHHSELKSYPMLGWITWLTAQGRVADRDPILPPGARILERSADTLTLQLSRTLHELTEETVQATRHALEEQRWLARRLT